MAERKIEILMNGGGLRAARDNAAADSEKLPKWLSDGALGEVREFHGGLIDETIPDGEGDAYIGYGRTPLCSLPALARQLGVKAIYVKDESKRFGLQAFKGLGASYAVAKAADDYYVRIGDAYMNMESGAMPFNAPIVHMGPPIFVTATDGNHGRAVAWAASKIPGAKARVFMPKGSAEARAEAIRSFGDTRCEITDMCYDDAVRYATAYAKRNSAILVQDTGFEGYEEIPRMITQGYTTMATEALAQIREQQTAESTDTPVSWPTHVFLQAGVGSMAGGVLGFLANRFHEKMPAVTIMEPSDVACVYASAEAGEPTTVSSSAEDNMPETEMAGLNCGEVNLHAWPILRDFATAYAKCPDWVTELGMRRLAFPVEEDPAIESGESGAVGVGLLEALMTRPDCREMAKELGLNKDSVVLLFSTEGATDPVNYKRIIDLGPIE